MIRVKDGKVIETELPQVGVLSDGRTVSGYHVLPEEILMTEGWLPEKEVRPLFDASTQELVLDKYEVLKSEVRTVYKAVDLAEPAPDEFNLLAERVAKLEGDVSAIKAAEMELTK